MEKAGLIAIGLVLGYLLGMFIIATAVNCQSYVI